MSKRKMKLIIFFLLALTLLIGTVVVYAAEVIVDGFTSQAQTSQVTWFLGDPLPIENCSYRSSVTGALGTHRDVCLTVTDASTDADLARLRVVTTGTPQLSLAADSSLELTAIVQWDGADATPALDPTGLGSQDLTGGGTNDGIVVRVISSDGIATDTTLRIYTDGSNWAELSEVLDTQIGAGEVVDYFFPFASFGGGAGTMNPASVGAVELEMVSLSNGPDVTIALLKATSVFDFGDLPDGPYPTLLASNGARHRTTTGLRLGDNVDAEGDGVPNASALGDDTAYVIGTADDEDGVVRQPGVGGGSNGGWSNGTVASGNGGRLDITINGGSGRPQVFIDFGNGAGGASGTLTEVTLRNALGTPLSLPLSSGTHQVYFDIPAGTFNTDGQPIAVRVRLSTAGGLAATGPAPDGEVEDYIYTFGPTAVFLQATNVGHSSQATTIAVVSALVLAFVSLAVIFYRRLQVR